MRCFTHIFQLVPVLAKAEVDDSLRLALPCFSHHTYHAMSGMKSKNSHK